MDLRLPVDGVMGPGTRSAIRSFQSREGLPEDGIAGPQVEAALVRLTQSRPPEEEPSDVRSEEEGFFGSIKDTVSSAWQGLTRRIEDRTHLTPKDKRKGQRDPSTVYALVLHQMAFSRGNEPKKYDSVTAHYAILPDGKILQLHPVSALLWASNGFNKRSVAVEFAGNFPSTRGKCWQAQKFGCHQLTKAQIEAGRYLVRHLIGTIGLTHILAHRQSSGTRGNDPGPDIWFHVGQWAIDNLGLKDGGQGFKIDSGNPIPNEWRTWGRGGSQQERMLQPFHDETATSLQEEIDPETPDHVQWLQRSLNRVRGLHLLEDGVDGPVTRSALRNFQKQHGLTPSGMLNLRTEGALMASGATQHRHPKRQDEAGPLELDPVLNQVETIGTSLASGMWEGEINRGSRDYMRWVQRSLNRLLGLSLAVDGISGPQTRSAVRSFQQQRGLVVDGIVGPQTEAALKSAGASNPPGSGTSPYVPPVPSSGSGQALRNQIAQIALQEWQRWRQGTTKECDAGIRNTLADYWRTGVGYVPSQSNYCSSVPWSAAFISWVMRKAGAGSAFRYSGRHTDYVGAAKQNRLANNSNPFKTYRITEVTPRPGDLVCKERSNSGVTYDNVDQGPRNSHCDIVVSVQPGQIKTIGGNLSDSVRQNTVATDANGRVSAPGFYAIVRVGA